jgi:hypothetical protein
MNQMSENQISENQISENPADDPGATPATEVEESDPNADSAEGVAGDMGVSSERKGPVRGHDGEVTYAASPMPLDDGPAEGEAPPEQSAYDGQPEVNPASLGRHESDPDSNPGHGV